MADKKARAAATKVAKKIGGAEYKENIDQIADAIRDVSAAAKILGSRLKRRAIIVLLKDSSGVSIDSIDSVLSAAENLASTYLK